MNDPKTYTKAEITTNLGVQPYIMALWEKQFGIQTTPDSSGEPLYTAEDFAKLAAIKELLYEKGLTIDAAKQYLQGHPQLQKSSGIVASPLLFESKKKSVPSESQEHFIKELRSLQGQLIKLRELL